MSRGVLTLTVLAAAVLVLSAGLVWANGLSSVADFEAGDLELPEGLAVDRQGNFYVGMAPTGEIKRVTPQEEVSTFAQLEVPEGGFLIGLAFNRRGDLFAALATNDAESNGVWRISKDGSVVEPFALLPPEGLPNYLAFDRQGNLFASDSTLGIIWKLDSAGNVQEWSADPLLATEEVGATGLSVGVNGIAFDHNQKYLYAANTLEGTILRIPVQRDGSAGEVELFVEDSALVGADGIAFDSRKNLYVAVNEQDSIVKVTPEKEVMPVVEGAPLDFPASLTFGVGRESKNLYITNFAILRAFGFIDGEPNPALLKLELDTPGRPLP
jgi:sugar lactone lactonase YvrE